MSLRVIVVVGEPSGDKLGAQLAKVLQERYPNIEIEGVIGKEMIAAGCLQLHTMDTLAVMGIVDPIMSLPQILRLRSWLIRYILEDPPDLFIGIDAPDFNLNLEKVLHKAGVTTVHYVSPSVWAWRQGRIKTIKKSVDLMLTLFPFEKKFYEQHNVPVAYIGHPTADLVPLSIDKQAAKEALGLDPADQVLIVMPGSRNSELKHMLPTYLQTMLMCSKELPQLKFVMPLVYEAYKEYVEFIKAKIAPNLTINYVIGDSFAAMRAADVALVTSGTASLELMLHRVPMVVAYKTNSLTYFIGKMLIKVKYIALPNLLSNEELVPEFIQGNATPEKLLPELLKLLQSKSARELQTAKFVALHQELQQNASETAATAIGTLLGSA